MFKLVDGRAHFYQWDINQKLIVEDASISEVHFCNRTDDCSLVVEVRDGLVDVPNILLQDYWKIRVYAYCCQGDSEFTKVEEVFEVVKRSKPADYVYTETEIKNYDDLNERLTQLEETGTSVDLSSYATKEYVEDALESFDVPSGVYYGTGTPPDNCSIHVNPEGDETAEFATKGYVDDAIASAIAEIVDGEGVAY